MTSASTFFEPPFEPLQAGGQLPPNESPREQPETNKRKSNRAAGLQPTVDLAPPVVDELPLGQPPDLDKNGKLHGRRPQSGQVVVVNSQMALEQIAKHSVSNLRSELGGVLLGQAYQSNGRSYVEVLAALPAVNDDHGPVHFTFTANGWSQLHKERAEKYPELQIVGWFHTHPNLGVFYSSDDVVVHSAAFTQPWHVGLVVDPVRREACYFGWENGELAPIAGYYEFHDQSHNSVVDWQAVQTAVFGESDSSYGYMPPARTSDGEPMPYPYHPPESELPELPRWASYVSLLASIVGFVTIMTLLFAVIMPQEREIEALQATVLTLAEQPAVNRNLVSCAAPYLRILTPISGTQVQAGTAVSFVGTANHPDAVRYRLQGRLVDNNTFTDFALARRGQTLGEIVSWDTSDVPAGIYLLQLTAVDSNNISLTNASVCQLQIEILPAPIIE